MTGCYVRSGGRKEETSQSYRFSYKIHKLTESIVKTQWRDGKVTSSNRRGKQATQAACSRRTVVGSGASKRLGGSRRACAQDSRRRSGAPIGLALSATIIAHHQPQPTRAQMHVLGCTARSHWTRKAVTCARPRQLARWPSADLQMMATRRGPGPKRQKACAARVRV